MAVFNSAVFNPAVFFTDSAAACLFNSDIFNNNIFNVCVAATSTVSVPSGVRRGKRKFIVNLADVENREDTAQFLKSQLKLRHPDSAFTETPQDDGKEKRRLAKQARREVEMRLKASLAAENFAREQMENETRINEQIAVLNEQIVVQNDNLRLLLMIGASI